MNKYTRLQSVYGYSQNTMKQSLTNSEYLINILDIILTTSRKIVTTIQKNSYQNNTLRNDESSIPVNLEAKLAYNELNKISYALIEIQHIINNDQYFSKMLYAFLYHGQELIYQSITEYNINNFNQWLANLQLIKEQILYV